MRILVFVCILIISVMESVIANLTVQMNITIVPVLKRTLSVMMACVCTKPENLSTVMAQQNVEMVSCNPVTLQAINRNFITRLKPNIERSEII